MPHSSTTGLIGLGAYDAPAYAANSVTYALYGLGTLAIFGGLFWFVYRKKG